jgi:hypothetical protein
MPGHRISGPRLPAWRLLRAREPAGTRRARVALAVAVAVALLLALAVPTDRAERPVLTAAAVRTWSPPACGDATHACQDIHLRDTGVNQTPRLEASVDYRIHLPSDTPVVGGIQIRGGHNVQIIGGEIDLRTPCDDSLAACHGINISKPTPGEVYIEGVYIRNPDATHSRGTGDGIDLDLRPGRLANDVVVQNVRIEGIAGCNPRNPASHADVLQAYRAPDTKLRIDRLTGTTDCQGLQLDPDLALTDDGTTAHSQTLRRVNVNVLRNPHLGKRNRYAYWFTHAGPTGGCVAAPTTLTDVWAAEPRGTLAMESVWPDTDTKGGCRSVWNARTRRSSFRGVRRLTGVVRAGRPDRDFVPVGGNVGLDYVRPPSS